VQPRPQSRRNEPVFLPNVLRAIASARGGSPEELAAVTTRNALTFFRWRDENDAVSG
jgi:TatD DNase family protein